MARFKRLTVEEARTLSREQLLPLIEDEQKHWYRLMNRMEMRAGDDDAFKTFNKIMHVVIGPGHSVSDAFALFEDESRDRDHWTKPLGELGDL